MKTAIEDYENKSGDKLHGVVFVPFFTTIFREQAKSLSVPSIKITLPNGESLVTAASKGVSTAVKTSTATAVKAGAVTAVKTKVIAMACGMTLLFASTTVGTSLLAGCNAETEPTEPSIISSTVQTSTVSSEVSKAIEDNGLKIDKNGNITDKNGKKVEVKDGKVEVKTDDGKTVTVKADDVKTTVSNNNNSNKGNTEKKEDTNSNTSGNNQEPAKPSNSSNNNQSSASNTNTKATEAPKYKYYKHHEAKTVYHEAVTKHHDAVTKHHDAEWVVTGTHEEPVYETRWVNVCNDCGKQLTDANQMGDHLVWELRENGGTGSYHAEEQQVQVGTKTVEDGEWKEAYDEVITPAWTETISPAWTETIPAYDEEVSVNDNWDKKVLIN